jgi:hypothetical protein
VKSALIFIGGALAGGAAGFAWLVWYFRDVMR